MSLVTVAPSMVPKFDPDQFLADMQEKPFDPDAFLHEMKVQETAKGMTPARSLARGIGQGASLFLGDELAGGVDAAKASAQRQPMPKSPTDVMFDTIPNTLGGMKEEDYRKGRDEARLLNEGAQRANRKTYLAGEIAGGLPYSTVGGLGTAAAVGAVQGAGQNSDDRRLLGDIGFGAGGGLLAGALGQAAGKGASAIRRGAAGKVNQSIAKADQLAAEQVQGDYQGLVSKYGGLRQTENNAIREALFQEANGTISPQNAAQLAKLKASGRIQEALNESLSNNLDFLEKRVPEVAATKADMQAAQQMLPQSIANRSAELQKPQFLKDAASLAKGWGEPLVANAIGGPAAGMVMGRTRMGKAIMNRVTRPGNQIALYKTLEAMAALPDSPGGELLRNALMRTPVPLLMAE